MQQAECEERRRAANAVGFGLVVFLACFQLARFIGNAVLATAFLAGEDGLLLVPEWAMGLCNILVQLFSLLTPCLLLLALGKQSGLRVAIGRGRLPMWILLPLFLGLMVAANSVSTLLESLAGLPFGGGETAQRMLPESPGGKAMYFLSSCVVAAVLEELFFRGAIQGLLCGWGAWFSIFVTSALFTFVHTTPGELPAVFALGLLLGYISWISHSVRPCIMLHFANNLTSFFLLWVREFMSGIAALAFVMWMIFLLVALFVGALWAVRKFHYGKRMWLKKDPPLEGGGRRLAALAKVPAFAVGFLLVCANFVWQLFAG